MEFVAPGTRAVCLAAAAALMASGGVAVASNPVPGKLAVRGAVSVKYYDGISDDLLTAGLGKSGLAGAAPVATPALDAAGYLRRLAIYNNYRALVDMTPGGGYGTLYGPNVDRAGNVTAGEGKVAGSEYIAYADDGSGRVNVTLMVQVPASFDAAAPCIVTAASSGSRGVYGAIGTVGEWGLKNGCAVAYTDKGTGNGIHDLQANTVSLQNGTRADALAAGSAAHFAAPLTEAQRVAYVSAFSNRFAVKHAHSQQNPEKDWGRFTLQAVEFAFDVLNKHHGPTRYTPASTLVIASSVSNGGGAALAAAEMDMYGLIDGVAVAEPSVSVQPAAALRVRRGDRTVAGTGRPLLDYFALANLYQPCAALANSTPHVFNTVAPATALARCEALRDRGLISSTTPDEMGNSAQAALVAAGYEPESAPLHASMFSFAVPAIVTTYANTYGRFSVLDNLCGWSFHAASAVQVPMSFGTGNGIPPTAGIGIVKNTAGGPAALSALEHDLDGALCVLDLVNGSGPDAQRVQQGMGEVRRSANLRGKPAIIVHGRADTLIPVGFTSRPYFGLNQMVEGPRSGLRYVEVTNAQHFEAFLGLPGYAANYLPLHRYFNQALDLMYAHLRSQAPLPPSQVVRTTPRGASSAGVNPISGANVPPIVQDPAPGDRITFSRNTVHIPD